MIEKHHISGRQVSAARALAGISQADLANAANISLPTLRRMEASTGPMSGMPNNVAAVVQALLDFGIIFIPSNGNGPGVRLRDRT
ncbi:helix-turn-helix domain-containing protein [Agrobacterium tumefaciens]|uniref:helix-turn-helix domain-containing protein n=1 Tax=Agrobacterium tumefaciens TaxID=358 RepID=UPI003B9E110A